MKQLLGAFAGLTLSACSAGSPTPSSIEAGGGSYPVSLRVVKVQDVANSCIIDIEVKNNSGERIKDADATFEVFDNSKRVIGDSRVYVANLMPDKSQVDHPIISMVGCDRIASIGSVNPVRGGIVVSIADGSALPITQ